MIYELDKSVLNDSMKKAAKNMGECKSSIFNLQYLTHFYMDFYATITSRSTVKKPFY